MRTEVIKLLDCSSKENKKIVKPSHDIILLNELVREYLDWMGYKYSSTVFIAGILCYFREYIYIYTYMCHHIKNDNRNCIKCKIIFLLKFCDIKNNVISECDLPKHSLDRTLLAQSLGVKDNEKSRNLPLLCGLVQTFTNLKNT